MKSLVMKDLWLHWRHFLVACGGALLLLALMKAAAPPTPARQEAWAQFYFAVIFFISGILFTEWLVVKECARRTILWVRTLPLSDWAIVGSRFVSHALMVWGLVAATVAVAAPGWIQHHAAEAIAIILAVQAYGGLILGGRMAYGAKAGLLVPLILFGAGAALEATGHLPAAVNAMAADPLLLALVSVAVYGGAFLVTGLVMRRREAPGWAP